jgi:hypothetical protein
MHPANDNAPVGAHRESPLVLALAIMAAAALWSVPVLWVWRAFGG